MNHRTTSACNCISVPIIYVSTSILFMKAVIIKSQVGEIWNTNAYLKKPFLCNSVSKYPEPMNCPGEFIFWNSIWKWFLGIWVPIKALCVTHGFLNIFWNRGGTKARKSFTIPPQTYCLNVGPMVNAGERVFCTVSLLKNAYSQNRRLGWQSPHPCHSHKHPTLQDSQPLNCLQNARTV